MRPIASAGSGRCRIHEAPIRPEHFSPAGVKIWGGFSWVDARADLGFAVAPDREIWSYAADHGFTIISKDADFQQRALLRGAPPKVVWVRLGNCSTDAIALVIRNRILELHEFEADPSAAFLVIP